MSSKSVLVIDTPESCMQCMMADINLKNISITCKVIGKSGEYTPDGCDRLRQHCPIKPLPPFEQQNPYNFTTYTNGVAAGFNLFRERITGENYADTSPYNPV